MISLSNKKFNFCSHNYLLNCDLINKYNLKSIYKKPKLKKIVLHFPIKQLLSINSTDNNLQVKAFLVFYIIFFSLSFINFDRSKISNNLNIDPEYSLKVIISNPEDINLLLLNLFVENYDKFNKEDLIFLKNDIEYENIEKKTNFCHNFSIPGKVFFDGHDFFFQIIKETNFKELGIKCSFITENLSYCKNINNTIKNISLFWVNN